MASGASELARRAVLEGRKAHDYANDLLIEAGFTDLRHGVRVPGGTDVSFEAIDDSGRTWLFDVAGGFSSSKPGLNRADVLWKVIGKAAVIRAHHRARSSGRTPARITPYVVLTTAVPPRGTAGVRALELVTGVAPDTPIHSVITLLHPNDLDDLRSLHLAP